ncbi:MAG: pectinesterase family protein [Prevotella sp.]
MKTYFKKLGLFFLMSVMAVVANAQEDVTATWDFENDLPAGIQSSTNYQGVEADIPSTVDGIMMHVDATNGKLYCIGRNNALFNSGTILQVPVKSNKDLVTVKAYPNYNNLTIGGVAMVENEETHKATSAEAAQGYVEVISTGSSYIYKVEVVHVSASTDETYDNVSGVLSWAVGNEDATTASAEIKDAVVSSSVTVGTDLIVSESPAYSALGLSAGAYVCYVPSTSNPGCVETDMIEYSVKLQKGLTFTPTSVEFDAVKDGTDNAYFSWSYTIDGVESAIIAYSDPVNQIRRNNNANPDAPLTHVEAISTTDSGREFSLRFYISNVANNKKMNIGNIKINGIVNGTVIPRAFKDFKIDFRTNPYTVLSPDTGLPQDVTVTGAWHDTQHGYGNAVVKIPVDGPVKLTIGGCMFSNQVTISDGQGNTIDLDTKAAGCDTNTSFDHFVTWVYNSETPTTLTVDCGSYCPFIYAEACDLLPMVNVTYYDTDGKTVLGSELVQGGSKLVYKYTESDLTIGEGKAFRGWFNSNQSTALKVLEGTTIQKKTMLYARATTIENPTTTSRYIYDLSKQYFYDEDHEAIDMTGKYHNSHGWVFSNGQTIKLKVAGKAYVSLGCCLYTSEGVTATVTKEDGSTVTTFDAKAATDGAEYSFQYDGEATTLTITFSGTTYIHRVAVSNVVEFVEYNEATGYYVIAPNDVSSFLLALTDANGKGNRKIFLPNGTYDLGETALTAISGNNISIIGESMTGTIIKNAPLIENEGIGTTATLLNSSTGLYLQDLTLQNALDYYKASSAGRAVCLQDRGANTICKNVRMLSYQDTYYSNPQGSDKDFYWEDCEIHGTVDYLCGGGNVLYNRCTFVNESRSATTRSGDATIAAPYPIGTTETAVKWGYVMLDCNVVNKCATFNWGRSWGGYSTLVYIRTKIDEPSRLAASRFTTGGMNIAAGKFMEYGTMDAEGNDVTPTSNVLTFTHSSGNRSYETIMTADAVAQYTPENMFPTWLPTSVAAQKEVAAVTVNGSNISWDAVEGATAYAIFNNDVFVTITDAISYAVTEGDANKYSVRAANARGGFGPAAGYTTGIGSVVADKSDVVSTSCYNLQGVRVNDSYNGVVIKVATMKDGRKVATKIVK